MGDKNIAAELGMIQALLRADEYDRALKMAQDAKVRSVGAADTAQFGLACKMWEILRDRKNSQLMEALAYAKGLE